MKNYKLLVKTKNKKYSIIIGRNLINNFEKILKKERIFFKKCLIVADKKIPKNIIKKFKKNIKVNKFCFYSFVSNEKNKNYKSVNKILNILFKENFSRDDCVISMGGGITGDVSGFACSIYKRGIKFINLPTTLLAQVDSSIGGKTGINNKYGKNLIGSFYQPDLVISDTLFLNSLPKRELVCGYGEILKHSIIASQKNFDFLETFKRNIFNLESPFIEKAIYESCKIKKNIIQKDEGEKNLRKVLNFGHTFAHAYEASLKFSNKLNHGEAVILGIISASKYSCINNYLLIKDYNKIINHIKSLNLNLSINKFFKKKSIDDILNFMKMDKKNKSSKINLILIKKFGKPIINLNFNLSKIKYFLKKELDK
tara:strand:- start:434 stop:1540 length:1107 start_codon:yes stop_codon:yes gene_type:complete